MEKRALMLAIDKLMELGKNRRAAYIEDITANVPPAIDWLTYQERNRLERLKAQFTAHYGSRQRRG